MTQPPAFDAQTYARHAAFVPALGADVLALLAPRPGERILDLGCGDGVLTRQIAAAGASVLGVDGAAAMVAAARAAGIEAREMDAAALSFSGAFDAVFSNAALHWMTDPDAVLGGVARALRPGGRFVGELGGHGNVAAIATALRAVLGRRFPDRPVWYFPDADAYAARLTAHGFTVTQIALIPRPTPLPTGIAGWLATFAPPFLTDVPAAEQPAVLAQIAALLAPALRRADGGWTADYVRLRFAAQRP